MRFSSTLLTAVREQARVGILLQQEGDAISDNGHCSYGAVLVESRTPPPKNKSPTNWQILH